MSDELEEGQHVKEQEPDWLPFLFRLFQVAAWLTLPLAWRGARLFRGLKQITPRELTDDPSRLTPHSSLLPSLSVIVPARNEAANLPRLLASWQKVVYPGALEVLVVDDNSTDETAVIAAQFGAKVLRLTELPSGWLGKPHACHRGVQETTGEWLLFTDADTVHSPTGVAQAMSMALAEETDGLTAFLGPETSGLADQLALLIAFGGLFVGLTGYAGLMNGQYILLKRSVYEASGGFAAVRAEPLEDWAFGLHLHRLGYRLPMKRGEQVATVRMYDSAGAVWRGLTRLAPGSLRWAGPGAVLTTLFIGGLVSPLLLMVGALLGKVRWWQAGLTWATAVASLRPWAKAFGAGWRVWLVPLMALFVQLAALTGLVNRFLRRGVAWKGRRV